MKKVGIIGGAGFIGSHITKRFLENGYEVKVSTVDVLNKQKYSHLMELKNAEHLYVSELNVEDKATLRSFVEDCDLVIHGGTPFLLEFGDAKKELIDPTIDGTKNFLEVISQTPSIDKVVFIASVAAYNTNFPLPAGDHNPDDKVCENSTPFISEESHPYAQAKFIANDTVNAYIKNNPDNEFEITSVSPVAVFGKALSSREDSTSTGLQHLIKNNLAPNPFVQMLYDTNATFAIVDVKDVATAVYNAATTKGLHGKNYLLSSETFAVSDISLMLNGKPPINEGNIIYKNELAKKELGVTFQPVRKTLESYNAG